MAPTWLALRPCRSTEVADEELLRRVAMLDAAAFEAFTERHGEAAFSLALRTVGSHTRADDVVQEAFIGLWRNAGQFDRARGTARSWLLGMVHHRAIDALRSASVHDRRRAAEEAMDHLPDARADVDTEIIRRAEAGRVRAALADLPVPQRHALELAYYGGLTHNQIAEALGVPLGTVKGRMRIGLERLGESLADLATASR